MPTATTAVNLVYITDSMSQVHIEEYNNELDNEEINQEKGEGSPV